MVELTPSVCQTLAFADETPTDISPVIQVLSVKKVPAVGSGPDRYRLIVSDGDWFMQAMLATQLNHMCESNEVEKNTVIKVTGFALNPVKERKLLVILHFDVLTKEEGKIGSPQNIDTSPRPQADGSSTSAASAAPSALAPVSAPAPPKPAAASRGGFSSASTVSGRGGASGSAQRGGRPGASGGRPSADHGPLYPIEGLSPYQNKWTIKARVTQKSDIKVWSNARGEGKLFSVTLMDETGEIKATGFNEAVDSFYEMLVEGKAYFITKARINIAKKQFSTVNNEYEITFDGKTEIDPCDDDSSVPQIKYNFIELSNLDKMEKDQTCDVLAVVKEVSEISSITGKASQRPITKRELTIVDRSEFAVRLTLWGKTAENYTSTDQPVVAFKGVKVGDFGGRTLSMFSSSSMSISPDLTEAHSLRGWFDLGGKDTSLKSHSNAGAGGSGAGAGGFKADSYKTIGEIKDENIGMNDTTDWFTVKGTAIFIKSENMSYPACSTDGCNKKVVEDGGQWRCEKCQKGWDQPNWRYILSISVVDHSGQMWLSCFNDVGEVLLGMTANEMKRLQDEDSDAAKAVVTKASGQTFDFNCSARLDTFNEQSRARFSIKRAGQISYASAAKQLMDKIKAYGVVC